MKKCKIIFCVVLAALLFWGAMIPPSYATESDQEKIRRLERELEEARKSGDDRYNNLLEQYNKLLEEQKEKAATPRVNISAEFLGAKAGAEAVVKVQVKNTSGANFSNGVLTLSTLPEGAALKNTSSTLAKIGELLGGQDKSTEFVLLIDKQVKTGSYPIGFTFSGLYGKNSDRDYSFSQTFYMEITNDEKKKEPSKLGITNVVLPRAAALGQEFALSFRVVNNGASKAENLKITAEPSGTLINKSRNVFLETVLEAGKSKDYSVTFYAPSAGKEEKVDEKNFPIKISVESTGAPSSGKEGETPEVISLSQYADILILGQKGKEESSGSDGVKSPQLMVENYSYGGSYVEAGKNFTLSLTMVNTSREKALRNIKISLTSEEGTFIPYNTSNSFYIDALAPGARTKKEITFSTKPDAKAQTIALNLDSAYEDMKGNALTAKDIISIPVMQVTKLDIDDASIPPEAYVGQPTSVSFSFYNTGKNVLRNLKITGEGNFDTQGNVSYFVGNMEPGKNDSYDLLLIPREPGEVSGTVSFTYEDVQGEIRTVEKTFSMSAMEPPLMDEEMMEELPAQKNYKPYYIGGAAAVLILGIFIWRRRRKKKKEQEMSLDE
ncbi:MAG: hypothetical protein Q4A78_07000 [Peptostreptococcaceae bacterium]|nr:hypothetical protein [Peptostreptococcaceae bacterium]